MPVIYVELSSKQIAAIQHGKTTTIRPSEEGTIVKLNVDERTKKRFHLAEKKDKGVRIMGTIMKVGGNVAVAADDEDDGEDVEGGAISLRDIGRSISRAFTSKPRAPPSPKQIVRNIKKVGNAIGNDIKRSGIDKKVKKFVNNEGVQILETAKKHIPKQALKSGLQGAATAGLTAAATLTAQPQLLAAAPLVNKGIDAGLDSVYKTDFRKRNALRTLGKNAKQEMGSAALDMAMGGSIRMKGSQAAKDHMARLRSMRKNTRSPHVAEMVTAIERKTKGRGMVPLGKGMVPL